MGSRREGREFCLQALYLWDNCKLSPEEALKIVPAPTDSEVLAFGKKLAMDICQKRVVLDGVIEKYALNWKIERMAAIDRNILRLAAFEMMFMLETPVNAIINEAVEIAKKYSTEESGKFVNGILDKIKSERAENPSPS